MTASIGVGLVKLLGYRASVRKSGRGVCHSGLSKAELPAVVRTALSENRSSLSARAGLWTPEGDQAKPGAWWLTPLFSREFSRHPRRGDPLLRVGRRVWRSRVSPCARGRCNSYSEGGRGAWFVKKGC